MIIGALQVELHLPGGGTLKDKRHVVKSLLARLINQYHIAAAEIAALDNPERAILGITCVSNSAPHANEVLSKVVSFIEANVEEGYLADYQLEIVPVF